MLFIHLSSASKVEYSISSYASGIPIAYQAGIQAMLGFSSFHLAPYVVDSQWRES